MNRVEYWAFHVNSWINRGNCFLISFNELSQDYVNTLIKISELIDKPLNEGIIDVRMKSAKQMRNLTKLKRMILKRGIKRSSILFREGKSNNWKDHFSQEDLEFFNEHSGNLNQKLGY